MRYYDIRMTDPDGNLLKQFGFAKSGFDTSYTSYLNGQTLPGALNVSFNIPQGPYATPKQGAWLQVWGVGIDELANTKVLGPPGGKLCGITIRAGMQKGLPLAKPSQAGLILDGSIFRPFGNWQMTVQTLEMVLLPAVGTNDGQQVNIPFNYPANTPLADAIKQSLATGLPKYTTKVAISPNLVLPFSTPGFYQNLNQFSAMLLKFSQQSQFQGITSLGGGTYGGVQVRIIGRTITVYDGTVDYGNNSFSNPKVLSFEDFIGQPTWTGPNSINLKMVLRADINVGDYVKLPNTLQIPFVLSTPNASVPGAPSRDNLTFNGPFVVINVRHAANSRNPNADSWCTLYDCSYVGSSGSIISNPPT